MSPEEARGYVAGIIDGEGHVRYDGVRRNRYVLVANTEPSIINAYTAALRSLGTPFRRRGPYYYGDAGKCYWQVLISKETPLRKLAAEVSLRSRAKQHKLQELVRSYV